MDINELESFKMSDAVKFHNKLNPNLWINSKLDPEVRDQLLIIANDFVTSLGLNDLQIKDVTVSGSNAAYSYTPHSDLDLHVLVDMAKLRDDAVYRELFTAKKTLYNDSHDITVHGVPVELYVQDVNEPVKSLGEYSVLHNKWIRIPKKQRANFDQAATKAKFDNLVEIVELALKTRDLAKVEKAIATIKRYRKAGLDKAGEFGPENLAFKAIRKQGGIQDLYDLRDKLRSAKLSIEEAGMDEDYDPNGRPPGPEFKPTMPAGTVRVDVSDVYDWYKLGQNISNLDRVDPKIFGKGPPSTIMAFGDEDTEHNYINNLKKLGLSTTDIDPFDPNQPKSMPRQKVDPTYNVNEALDSYYPYEGKAISGRYTFETENGVFYKVYFQGRDLVEIAFSAILPGEEENFRPDKTTITGTGNSRKVFGTVVKIVQDYVDAHEPKALYFISSDEPSRLRLYQTMTDQVGKALPDYYAVKPTDLGDGKAFMLKRKNTKVDEAPRTFQSQVTPLEKLVQDYGYLTTFGMSHLDKQGATPEAQQQLLALVQRMSKDGKTFANLDKQKMETNRDTILSHIHSMMQYAIPVLKKNLPADKWEAKRSQINAVLTAYNNTRQINEEQLDETVEENQIVNVVSNIAAAQIAKVMKAKESKLLSLLDGGLSPKEKLELFGVKVKDLNVPNINNPLLKKLFNILYIKVNSQVDFYDDPSAPKTLGGYYDNDYTIELFFPALEYVAGKRESQLKSEIASTLAHEIQHAIDDYKSENAVYSGSNISPAKDMQGYLKLPYEVNARFQEATMDIAKYIAMPKKDGSKTTQADLPELIRYAFEKNRLDKIYEKNQKEYKRLLTRAYKFFQAELNSPKKATPIPQNIAKRALNWILGRQIKESIAYHVTPTRNLRSIMKDGLVPQIGNRSSQLAGENEGIFLFPSVDDVEAAVSSWLGDEFDEDEDLSLLAVDISGLEDNIMHGADYETIVNTRIDPRRISVSDALQLNEASGYIPSEKEKNDPRFKTALTVDVKPDSIKKNAKAFNWKTSRAGIPPQANPNGKIAEDLMNEWRAFLAEDEQQELFPGYDEQHRQKRLGNWLAKSWGVQNGKPQTFYHATTKDFDTFNTHGTGFASALGMAYEVERHGSFFAVDPKFAEGFIEDPNTGRVREGGRVLPVHLSIQSPIDLRDDALSRMLSDEETREEFKANDIDLNSIYNHMYELERWELFDGPEGAEFIDNLQKLGFDGAIINEAIPNNSNAKSGQVWVAFSPNQVKSVYNRGSFSPDDNRLMREDQKNAVPIIGYHVTATKNLPIIQKNGIKADKRGSSYIWDSREMAEWFMDFQNDEGQDRTILKIDMSGLDANPDPEAEDMSEWSSRFKPGTNGGAWIISGPIPPKKIIPSLMKESITEGHSEDLFNQYNGRMMEFSQLPIPAKKAVAHYMTVEGDRTDFADELLFGYVNLPMDVLTQAVMSAPDNDFGEYEGDWDSYHKDYWSPEKDSDYDSHLKDMWPVILDDGEGILDGWHRLHWYYRNGVKMVPALLLSDKG